MRILAIGLGGAGGRIVSQLYRTDRRSSKIACVEALAIDVDPDSVARLTGLPEQSKLAFLPLDLSPSGSETDEQAAIDITEITGRVQMMATGETDAIVICAGLGGSMVDAAPHIITALRSSLTEPIFALVTLPCLSEGERISAKAADDIETIAPLLDGVIVFDNETWRTKAKALQKSLKGPDDGIAARFGLVKPKEPALSPRERIYSVLNEAIVRRISLILRAGEFRADGGVDLAEVVLDAGEVLNTMKGMGFITVGYAVEQLPARPLEFLARFRPATGLFSDDHHKKASRIVDLAKQAIYHEVSAPCDITSAHKALILIAGPSQELSMKGFMTVRKWIDRSIAGLETRSGDYPVTSTKFIAIIIMLSGLENIPRINELREIRAQYRTRIPGVGQQEKTPVQAPVQPGRIPVIPGSGGGGRDEMTSMKGEGRSVQSEQQPPAPPPVRQVRTEISDSGSPVPVVRKVQARQYGPAMKREGEGGKGGMPFESEQQERRRIEEDLQRQRRLAIQGLREQQKIQKRTMDSTKAIGLPKKLAPEAVVPEGVETPQKSQDRRIIVAKQAANKVVLQKKSMPGREPSPEEKDEDTLPEERAHQEPHVTRQPLQDSREDNDLLDTWIRQVAGQKTGPSPDKKEGIRIEEQAPATRDAALLHTDLKRERSDKTGAGGVITGLPSPGQPREIAPAGKKRDRTKDEEDLSWVD